MRSILKKLSVLQDEQLKEAQQKLAQAGIRSKDAAVAVIFARMILPIVIGGAVCVGIYALGWLADWSALKRPGVAAGSVILSYMGHDIYVKNLINKRLDATRKRPEERRVGTE